MNEPKQEPFCEVFFSSSSDDKGISSILITRKFRGWSPPSDKLTKKTEEVAGPSEKNTEILVVQKATEKDLDSLISTETGRNIQDKKNKDIKETLSIDDALRFSKPIEIKNYSLNEKVKPEDFALAKLKIFDTHPANPLLPVAISTLCGNYMEVSYFREQLEKGGSNSHVNELGPDDFALVTRIFLLNKISKLKEDMRISLNELTKELKNLSQGKKNLEANKQGSVKRRSIKVYLRSFRRFKFQFIKSCWSRFEKYLTSCFKALCSLMEDYLSKLVKKASSSPIFQMFMWVTGVLVIVDLLFYLLAPSRPHLFGSQITVLIILLIFLTTCFVLLALNFKDKEDRAQNEICEKTNSELGEILSELTQNNANVTSLNTSLKPVGQAPEMLLRHFDQVLHIKEAVTGLEKVILARQRDVVAQISHVKEHQERARRAATAAAGGIFIGFFTFEVGERVFKFMHLIHGQDERSMFFWLTTEAGPFANPDLVNAQKGIPPELKKALCDSKGLKDCKTVEQPFDSMLIREHFMKQYQQSEMHAYGVLLAITLVVSLIAAAIGWRKPAEEQAGVHGGHH